MSTECDVHSEAHASKSVVSFQVQVSAVRMSLSDAHYFEEMGVKKYEEIRVLLDSREKKDKLEGMKRLIAMISIGMRLYFFLFIFLFLSSSRS